MHDDDLNTTNKHRNVNNRHKHGQDQRRNNSTYRPKRQQQQHDDSCHESEAAPREMSENCIDFSSIKNKKHYELMELAESLGIEEPATFKHHDLVVQIIRTYIEQNQEVVAQGVLEIMQEGFGFLRFPEINYTITTFDIFMQGQKIRKWNLKSGDLITTQLKAPKDNEKYFAATNLYTVNGKPAETLKHRVNFEQLTPIYPTEKINFELNTGSAEDISLRACDLVVPVGFGQRALIIAQPRTGKTVLMQNMAHAIVKNHPDVELLVLLIDERPEEVTDMKRSVKGEVISSTFDEPATRHIQIAELVIEKAKRMTESGKDVVLFLDSITRLARAYNTVTPSSGKILTGGIDASAMEGPKKIFGSARNTEEQGSLTIIGTALDKNKSQMDYYILQEFSGTGNCELFLDRNLSDRRIYPAIDITLSGTRNEEKFFETENELHKRWAIRKIIIPMGPIEGMSFLIDKIKHTKSNKHLFDTMNG